MLFFFSSNLHHFLLRKFFLLKFEYLSFFWQLFFLHLQSFLKSSFLLSSFFKFNFKSNNRSFIRSFISHWASFRLLLNFIKIRHELWNFLFRLPLKLFRFHLNTFLIESLWWCFRIFLKNINWDLNRRLSLSFFLYFRQEGCEVIIIILLNLRSLLFRFIRFNLVDKIKQPG